MFLKELWKKLFKTPNIYVETIRHNWEPVWTKKIGNLFILIDNEKDSPPVVAKLIDGEFFYDSVKPVFDVNGKRIIPGGIILPYDEKLWAFIQTLDQTNLEVWNLFKNISSTRDIMHDSGYRIEQKNKIHWY